LNQPLPRVAREPVRPGPGPGLLVPALVLLVLERLLVRRELRELRPE